MSDAVSSEEHVVTQTTNGEATVCPNSNWSREQLTHGSRVLLSSSAKDFSVAPALWGRPGHLTEIQADVYVSKEHKKDDRIILYPGMLGVICCLVLFCSVFCIILWVVKCHGWNVQRRPVLEEQNKRKKDR